LRKYDKWPCIDGGFLNYGEEDRIAIFVQNQRQAYREGLLSKKNIDDLQNEIPVFFVGKCPP
jgi:hypothetical protein